MFAEGDLQRIAATLASIRQGLALVGNVPEFRGGSAKLAVRCAFPHKQNKQFIHERNCLIKGITFLWQKEAVLPCSGALLP